MRRRRTGEVAVSSAARALNDAGRLRTMSPARSGKASQRPRRRMRPWRGPDLEVGPEQRAEHLEEPFGCGRMQPVGAVVHPLARDLEAAGHAAHGVARLQQRAPMAGLHAAQSSHEAGGARPDHDYLSHAGEPGFRLRPQWL